jgi:hypothetical protein
MLKYAWRDGMRADKDLVGQTVVDVDAPRAGASQVADQLLERRRRLERVGVASPDERLASADDEAR